MSSDINFIEWTVQVIYIPLVLCGIIIGLFNISMHIIYRKILLKCKSQYFTFTLSICDCLSIVSMALQMYFISLRKENLNESKIIDTTSIFTTLFIQTGLIMWFFINVSNILVIFITLDRYLIVFHPIQYHYLVKSVYIVSIILAIFIGYLFSHLKCLYMNEFLNDSFLISSEKGRYAEIIGILTFLFEFTMPLFIHIYCYVKILKHFKGEKLNNSKKVKFDISNKYSNYHPFKNEREEIRQNIFIVL
ncbi:hypothetical protein A3Q56_05637, partial [Intoshia linei]